MPERDKALFTARVCHLRDLCEEFFDDDITQDEFMKELNEIVADFNRLPITLIL